VRMDLIDGGHLGGNAWGGDPFTFEPRLWRHLVDRFQIRTVLDVGCGQGHAMLEFSRLGCWCVGVDGWGPNARFLTMPIITHDLTANPLRVSNIDLVWSCEVAEHIEKEYVDNFVATLACGRYIAMTFCPPGGKGHHHVNCQPEEYWIDLVVGAGYRYMRKAVLAAREAATHEYFSDRGLLFERTK
jgi:SAM-dependent methyltransferase